MEPSETMAEKPQIRFSVLFSCFEEHSRLGRLYAYRRETLALRWRGRACSRLIGVPFLGSLGVCSAHIEEGASFPRRRINVTILVVGSLGPVSRRSENREGLGPRGHGGAPPSRERTHLTSTSSDCSLRRPPAGRRAKASNSPPVSDRCRRRRSWPSPDRPSLRRRAEPLDPSSVMLKSTVKGSLYGKKSSAT